MHRFDVESANDFRERFERCSAHAAPVVDDSSSRDGRMLAIRLGAEQEALEYINRADAACEGKSRHVQRDADGCEDVSARSAFAASAPAEKFIAALGHESRPAGCDWRYRRAS